MSKKLLFLSLAVALCGCGETVDSPPVAAKNSVKSGPAEPVAPAKSADNQDDSKTDDVGTSDSAGKEEMADESPAVAGKSGKKPAPTGDEPEGEETADNEEDTEEGQPGKVSFEKQFQAARRAMAKGDAEGALKALEKALPDNPENASLLFNLAVLNLQVAGSDKEKPDYEQFKKSGDYLRRCLKSDPNIIADPRMSQICYGILYTEVCILAKDDKPAEACKALEELVAVGFTELDQLEKSKDLDSVRALPEYPEFLTKLREAIFDRIFTATKPFDFTFELTDIEGNAIASGDLKGKVAIIDVWGTWCPPCKREIPHFVELQAKYKEAGLEIVGLNREQVDDEEALQIVKDFHKEHKMNYRCALIQDDLLEKIPDFQGFPTTLFLDRTGKIRARTVGYEEFDVLDKIVSRLLNEKPDEEQPGAEDKSADDAKPATEEKPAADAKPTTEEKSDKEAKSDETGK